MLHEAQAHLLRALDCLLLLLGDDDDVNSAPAAAAASQSPRPSFQDQRRRRRRGASLTMVRPSTQQAVDRVVGTAAVVGLSFFFIRWLSSHVQDESKKSRAVRKWGVLPWWWPAMAVRSWKNKRRKSVGDDGDEKGVSNRGENIMTENERDGDDDAEEDHVHEHYGSCHCGSIYFVLRGPRNLRAVNAPGKIQYPHVPTLASKFELLRGESEMKFYYEEENAKSDDSSSVTFDNNVANGGDLAANNESYHADENDNTQESALGAHVFCGNCGVHVFHADRSTGRLEVNANCLDGLLEDAANVVYREQSSSGLSSISNSGQLQGKNSTIETVAENEPFLGGQFSDGLVGDGSGHHDNQNYAIPRKESVTSDPTTQSESYSTSHMMGNESVDELSMGSSSITGYGASSSSMPVHLSSLSVASSTAGGTGSSIHDRMDRAGLPPLPPSGRMALSTSDRSVKTLPPRHPGYRPGISPSSGGSIRAGTVGGGWSVASMESNDLDGDIGKGSTISPKMRDQMKKYMGRHMSSSSSTGKK